MEEHTPSAVDLFYLLAVLDILDLLVGQPTGKDFFWRTSGSLRFFL